MSQKRDEPGGGKGVKSKGRLTDAEAVEQEIERRVRERTQELTDARDALEKRLAAHEAVAQALRESEARYRLLAEHASDMISRHGPDGSYRYVSPSCLPMLGYKPEELLGKSAFAGVHPDDEPILREVRQQLQDTGIGGPAVFRKRRRDGSYIWAEVTGRAVNDPATGAVTELIAVTRDITERRRAEQQLRLIESAVKQADEAVLITDAQLERPGPRIEYANPAFERMTGYTSEEVIGKTPRMLQGSRTSRAVLDQLRTQLSQGKPFQGETFNYRKDGGEYVLSWHIGPVRDEHGRITHWVSIQRDITAQKQAEQLARQRQAELIHVSRLSTMGELASELAHELNQPLAAISSYVQGALNRIGDTPLDPEASRDLLGRVAAQADRASQIIRRLRRFVRKREPQRTLVDVNELIRGAIELIEPELRHQSVQIDLALMDNLPQIAADPVQIEQVLLNLMRNAMEAMDRTPTPERKLCLASEVIDDAHVQISVRDNGYGIPKHQLDHIFEPFFTTKQRGMGMGLPISHSIAEAHGGRIEAHPLTTGGMDFRLILPTEGNDVD
ncbi:PAS domain S-box protein [Phycisphaerales bacterium AB-hyl4]|uniref:histidine kinase n=1 Tax=Natronomicrosphaera hydrolytica TaxID=3242702 RepID=A0ABV4U443_9BACT